MPSERGPKGDHGQHGDVGPKGITGPEGREGVQGITGERGKVGDTGEAGVAGKTGKRGPAFAGPIAWIILVVVICAVLFAQGCQIKKNTENAHKFKKTTAGLCAIRAQHAHEVVQANQLLKEHEGAQIFGIPRGLFEDSRDEDQATVDALSELDCPP